MGGASREAGLLLNNNTCTHARTHTKMHTHVCASYKSTSLSQGDFPLRAKVTVLKEMSGTKQKPKSSPTHLLSSPFP